MHGDKLDIFTPEKTRTSTEPWRTSVSGFRRRAPTYQSTVRIIRAAFRQLMIHGVPCVKVN